MGDSRRFAQLPAKQSMEGLPAVPWAEPDFDLESAKERLAERAEREATAATSRLERSP